MYNRMLFISDLHLSAESHTIWQNFVSFCTHQLRKDDQLFILGDLMDSWIGDDDDADWVDRLRTQLRTLKQRGIGVAVMRGNRDFLLGQAFCRSAGVQLLADPCSLEVDGRRIVLTHGDGLCTQERDYMKWRRLCRSHSWQQQFLKLPLLERRRRAAALRTDSQRQKDLQATDVAPEAAQQILVDWGGQVLIHGHTHNPGVDTIPMRDASAIRYVLSDWRPEAHYLLITPSPSNRDGEAWTTDLLTYPEPSAC